MLSAFLIIPALWQIHIFTKSLIPPHDVQNKNLQNERGRHGNETKTFLLTIFCWHICGLSWRKKSLCWSHRRLDQIKVIERKDVESAKRVFDYKEKCDGEIGLILTNWLIFPFHLNKFENSSFNGNWHLR